MRVRIEVLRNADDPTKDLEIAASLRRDLWVYSPIEIDPEDPGVATKRTTDTRTAYFEFETEFPEEVERVIHEHGYVDQVIVVPAVANTHPSNT